MRYHKTHLTRRLILETSADSEKEENMVEWLRVSINTTANMRHSLTHTHTHTHTQTYYVTHCIFTTAKIKRHFMYIVFKIKFLMFNITQDVGMPAEYVNKLARMFQDMKVSEDLNGEFKDGCQGTGTAGGCHMTIM